LTQKPAEYPLALSKFDFVSFFYILSTNVETYTWSETGVNKIALIECVKSNITSMFSSVSFVQVSFIQNEKNEPYSGLDLLAEAIIDKNKKIRLLFAIKPEGQPRYARMAAIELKTQINQNKDSYGIFVAPYISNESKIICRDNNIGFMDLAGNYLFSFKNVYLNREGQINPSPNNRPVKSIFTPKSSRILRVLLCNPKNEWYVQDLAKEAKVSIGQTSNIKKQLLDMEYLEEKLVGKKIKLVLKKPELLLQEWSENYKYSQNKSRNYYTLHDLAKSENDIIEYFTKNKDNYAFTLTSGASRITPHLRYKRIYFYYQGDIDQMVKELGWKEVDTGPNITIMDPYDSGIFYQLQDINHAKIVSNVQLYLDLLKLESRGKEAAQYLLDQKLRKEW
jgi:hypothetical protein